MVVRPMSRIHLVRHGRAEAGWDSHADPGLDETGWAQAHDLAERLAPLGPLSLITSPLLRCRLTAEPLAKAWSTTPTVEAAVAEIPSPDGVDMADRVIWLRRALDSTWSELGPAYVAFRDGVVERVATCATDTVVVSHFVAINAVIGACLGDDRVVIRRLDNCSVTVVEVTADGLELIEGGHEADTLIR